MDGATSVCSLGAKLPVASKKRGNCRTITEAALTCTMVGDAVAAAASVFFPRLHPNPARVIGPISRSNTITLKNEELISSSLLTLSCTNHFACRQSGRAHRTFSITTRRDACFIYDPVQQD